MPAPASTARGPLSALGREAVLRERCACHRSDRGGVDVRIDSVLRGGAAILRRVLLLSLNDCKLAGDIVRWSSVERMVVGMIASAMQQPVRRVTAR